MSEQYTIKQISELASVSIHTLRYYERIGLIDPVERADNGHRRYDVLVLKRLDFLKRLKATGMPISQMIHYIELFRQGDPTLTERREFLEQHRENVLEQLVMLQDTLALLDFKIENYLQQEKTLTKQEKTA